MSVLTTINGIPLFSTLQEAMAWAVGNNVSGYHTHTYEGQTGYMGGATHGAAASSAQGLNGSNQNSSQNTPMPNIPPSYNSGGGGGSSSGGGGGGGY